MHPKLTIKTNTGFPPLHEKHRSNMSLKHPQARILEVHTGSQSLLYDIGLITTSKAHLIALSNHRCGTYLLSSNGLGEPYQSGSCNDGATRASICLAVRPTAGVTTWGHPNKLWFSLWFPMEKMKEYPHTRTTATWHKPPETMAKPCLGSKGGM